jgi:plastocyanin
VAAACALALGGFALASEVTVQLHAEGPQPETVTVNWSDSVSFTNADSEAHTLVIPGLTVTSPAIPPGGTFTQVFDRKKGTFIYTQTGTKPRNGRVVVKLQGEVTLTAAPNMLKFGESTALTGKSPYPSSPVVISQRPIGSTAETVVATLTAAEDGSFSSSFSPQSGSRLRAAVAAGQLRSAFVTVKVIPRLTITANPRTRRAGRIVTVTGRVGPANAAQRVSLDRYSEQRKAWNSLSTKPVPSSGTVAFRWNVAEGKSLLRLRIARADVETGFQPTVSGSVAVKGVAVIVRPRLTIAASPKTQLTGHFVTVAGRVAPAGAARKANLERYDARRHAWERLGTRLFSHSGTVKFKWRAEKGRSLLRLRVTRADAARGFRPAVSRTVAVKGLAPHRP